MNLPLDIIYLIFHYLEYDNLYKFIDKNMHIDYTMSKYNTSYKYAKGLYQNFMNNCFLCDKFLNKTYLMNFCSCCNVSINQYPMICNDCSKEFGPRNYGKLVHANCINCNKKSIHLNISIWS